MADLTGQEPRRLSVWLLAAIICAPPLFVWFLLRRGYSNTLRAGGFAFAGLHVALGLARLAETPLGN